jgi:hypothetical protein
VKFSENPVFHERVKHIEREYYFLHDRVHRGEVVLQYIFTIEQIVDILVKPLFEDEKFVHLRDKLVLMEMTSLLEKEEITPRLGGSTGMLLIYGKSFSISKNGLGWEVTFQSRKWPIFLMNKHLSISENGPDHTDIFVMKMV